jgi:lambda family phage tail tape measure protein
MALNLDTAIRLTAQVQGANNIRGIATNLQQLNSTAQLSGRQLDKLYTETQRFAAAAGNSINAIRQQRQALTTLRDAADPASRRFQLLTRDIDQLDARLRRLQGTTRAAGPGLGAALGGLGAGFLAQQAAGSILQASVAGIESERRLKSLSQGLDEYRVVQDAATASAQRFGISQTEANQSFAQIYARLRPIGLSLDEITTVYNGFNTAAKLSGTSSTEASAAFLQLSQALGTGVLRGEELNSVFEQTPAVVQAIAQVMGVPIGRIRDLAKEGQITGDIVLKALAKIEQEGAPKLVEAMQGPAQQFTNLRNASNELQRELGEVLVPKMVDAAKTATAFLQAYQGLPKPVKDLTANAVLLTGAMIGLNAAVRGLSFIGAISGITATGTAATTATGQVTSLRLALLGLARLGVITVGVSLIVNGLQELQAARSELQNLRKMREAGGAAASFPEGVTGEQRRVAQRTLAQIAEERKRLQRAGVMAAIVPGYEAFSPSATRATRARVLEERAERARAILQQPTRVLTPEESARQPALPPGAAPATGAAKAAADKAAKDAEKTADHQRRLAEGLAQREQELAVQRYQNEMDMQDTLHRLSMQQIEEERQARRGLIEAQAELAIAQAPESERWLMEFRRNLINVHTSTTDAILEQERRIAEKRQELARAEARLRLAEMNERTQVIRTTTLGGAGGSASEGGPVGRLLKAAQSNLGLFAGQTERCADAIRKLYDVAGIAIGTTKKAWDGLASGGRLASSFFGSDIGQRIDRPEDLRPGDLVGFERTYGRWGPGVQTHVGMYAGEGMMFDHSSRSGLTKRPLSTLGGKFMYGVRPYALGGDMVTTLPPGQAGREAAQGEVARARVNLKAAEENRAKLLAIIQQTGAAQLGTVVAKQIEEINQPLDQLAKSAGDRLAFEREYGELLRTGINPELAQQYVEIDRIAQKRRDDLQASLRVIERNAQAKGISDEQKATYEQQAATVRGLLVSHTEQVNKIKEELRLTQEITRQRGLQQDMRIGQGAREGVEGYIQSIGTMREATAQLTQEGIRGLEDQLTSLATTGKANFQEFAVSVLNATARMIIQQLVLGTIFRALRGGSQFAQSFQMPSAGFLTSGFSFAGGGYTGNAPRSGGLDGQGGFLAMLHPRETVVDHQKGQGAAAGPTYVTVNVNTTTGETQSTATDSDRRRLGQDIAQVVDARIVHHRRPGGLLNPSRR